jgi:2-(1,2-epoxy-1,2-dihydrophenyl)acetyl-CoA isomerase
MPVTARLEDGIGWIELEGERPFTIDESFPGEFTAALDTVEQSGARALVLAGTTAVFCAGANLKLAPRLREPEFGRRWLKAQHEAAARLAECRLPTVAAVNGAAAGAGCNLAIACDHVVAAERAGFSQAFIRIGLATDMGSIYLLPRRVGFQAARELMLTGREVAGEEALRLGLADQLAPADSVRERAGEVAAARAAGPLAAYAAVKEGLARGAAMEMRDGLHLEAALQMDVMAHPDFAEGSSAFLEKRPPRYGA